MAVNSVVGRFLRAVATAKKACGAFTHAEKTKKHRLSSRGVSCVLRQVVAYLPVSSGENGDFGDFLLNP